MKEMHLCDWSGRERKPLLTHDIYIGEAQRTIETVSRAEACGCDDHSFGFHGALVGMAANQQDTIFLMAKEPIIRKAWLWLDVMLEVLLEVVAFGLE